MEVLYGMYYDMEFRIMFETMKQKTKINSVAELNNNKG